MLHEVLLLRAILCRETCSCCWPFGYQDQTDRDAINPVNHDADCNFVELLQEIERALAITISEQTSESQLSKGIGNRNR